MGLVFIAPPSNLSNTHELSDFDGNIISQVSDFLTVTDNVGVCFTNPCRTSAEIDDMLMKCRRSEAFCAFATTCRRHAELRTQHSCQVRIAMIVLRGHARVMDLGMCESARSVGVYSSGVTYFRLRVHDVLNACSRFTTQERKFAIGVARAIGSWLQIIAPEVWDPNTDQLEHICLEIKEHISSKLNEDKANDAQQDADIQRQAEGDSDSLLCALQDQINTIANSHIERDNKKLQHLWRTIQDAR